MKPKEVIECQFQSYKQLWQAAGWVVFCKKENGKVILSIACHETTGRIVKIIIFNDDAESWEQATFMKLAEHRSS